MTGAIARDEADVVGTMLAQCCDRDLIMNYLTPVTFRHFYVYFKQPNLANDIFLSQFNLVVWMTCLAMVLALCLSMILTILVGVREPNATRAAFSTLDSVSWTFCKCLCPIKPLSSNSIILFTLKVWYLNEASKRSRVPSRKESYLSPVSSLAWSAFVASLPTSSQPCLNLVPWTLSRP